MQQFYSDFWSTLELSQQLLNMAFQVGETYDKPPGLQIDCSKPLNIFDFAFGLKTIFHSFSILYFQKNLKSIAFPIVCEKGVILPNQTV